MVDGDADHWKSCGEYVHSYIHAFRICIGCYTGVVLEEKRCRFKIGNIPGLPLDAWTLCRQFRRGRVFQQDDGDWQFLNADAGANYRDRYDSRYYRYEKSCSKWYNYEPPS